MPRPVCPRRIAGRPAATIFKPAGIPLRGLPMIVLTLDEFEALRLADLDARYQSEGAASMRVSRATFSRIVESARRKVADALVHGRALRIEGGPVHLVDPHCCRMHDLEARRQRASAPAPAPAAGGEPRPEAADAASDPITRRRR